MFGILPKMNDRTFFNDELRSVLETAMTPTRNQCIRTSIASQLSFFPGENADNLIMTVPGISKDDLQVTKDDRYLHIRKRDTQSTADKIAEQTGQNVGLISDFYDQQIPVDFSKYDTENISVEVNDGILHITLPKYGSSKTNGEIEIT